MLFHMGERCRFHIDEETSFKHAATVEGKSLALSFFMERVDELPTLGVKRILDYFRVKGDDIESPTLYSLISSFG